jgi:hypothetical protein
MRYFKEVEIPEYSGKIDYSSGLVLLGSCFTEEIGNILRQLKFQVDINPFGILYNPASIANSLKILLERRFFNPDDLFLKEGRWYSFAHHSRFASVEKNQALDRINGRIQTGSENIRNAGYLFLTFGTSWVYALKATGRVVANCHKVPAPEFTRYRMETEEILELYSDLLEEIWRVNPGVKVIFTVSPIRHWKDGAIENQVSKATLIVAITKILERFKKQPCHYFPSYEIVMDELRDYRFYASDMIHLSEVAVTHIWEKFEQALIAEESQKIAREIRKIQKAILHKPMEFHSPEFEKFITHSLKKISLLQKKYSYLNLDSEREFFIKQRDSLNRTM